MLELVLNKLGLKRLELYDGKLSRTVLRGWKRWQRLFYYPTLKIALNKSYVVVVRNLRRVPIKYRLTLLDSPTPSITLFIAIFILLTTTKVNANEANISSAKPQLLIFVSSSMPMPLLKSYYKEASKYGGVLVFKGVPNGSFNELGRLVTEIHGDMPDNQGAGSIIDDTAFERFGIKNVPSFVLYKEEECFGEASCKVTYDKLIGNIGVKAALLKFEEEGDLREESSKIVITSEHSDAW